MSRRLEKLIEQKAWETLTDYGHNDAQLLEQLTDATIEKLTEQAAGMPDVFDPPPGGSRLPDPMNLLGSWGNIIGLINQVMETISQGLPQHSEFDALASMVDYDGDGQVTFSDLTIALGLWGQGIVPASAQDYQAGALFIDDSGLGEPIPPEGEELLSVLTSGQQIKGSVGPRPLDGFGQVGGKTDPALKFSRPLRGVRPLQMPNRNVSRMGPQLGMGGPPAMPGGMG